jgi:transcriptional antiterminator RfaH
MTLNLPASTFSHPRTLSSRIPPSIAGAGPGGRRARSCRICISFGGGVSTALGRFMAKREARILSWAVAVTVPKSERNVCDDIREGGLEVFYPQIKKTVRRHGKTRHRFDPLFPGYLFVFVVDAWRRLLGIDGVRGVLMACDRPAVVPGVVIDEMRNRCNGDGVLMVPAMPRIKLGSSVRVKVGPLAGLFGVFDGEVSKREAALLYLLGCQRRVLFNYGELAAA